MAGPASNISIRMDAELKAQADALFAELGMNLSTAFNIFVRQCLREGGIPFRISLNPLAQGPAAEPVRISIAKGKLESPDDLDKHNGEISRLMGELKAGDDCTELREEENTLRHLGVDQ